jgi:phage tail sheath protein FI
MAEALISPGVFLTENDQSQITAGPITVGAALVGPAVYGPVNIPTLVTSYSDYKATFGGSFITGGFNAEYFTSIAAYNYFQQGGTSLLVTRVASGSYTYATASVPSLGEKSATVLVSSTFADGAFFQLTGSAVGKFFVTSSTTQTDAAPVYYVVSGSTATLTAAAIATKINSVTGFNILATGSAATLQLTASLTGTVGNGFSYTTGSSTQTFAGGITAPSFVLETLSVGTVMNNNASASAGQTTNGLLPSGSVNNIRWEITQVDTGSGYFSLIIRQGNDYNANKSVLETWSNISLDPNQNNYISYVIGNQAKTVLNDGTGNYFLQITGSYPNISNYVRISNNTAPARTPNYLNPQGQAYSFYTGSMPALGSGSINGAFGGASGPLYGCLKDDFTTTAPLNLYEAIPAVTANTDANNTQGLRATDYDIAINLLSNSQAYMYNSIYLPGITTQNGTSEISTVLVNTQNRGDAIAVVDVASYGQSINTVTGLAQPYNTSYGATYWPWLQVRSTETGRIVFVPASTIIPGVYEYNDKVSAEWFAPAGLNRGGLPTVIQPERRLSVNDRNNLYAASVNPIAVFPGQGTVVYGQKTLQAQASALDRVNVRRLLIALKSYIGQIAGTLVFEQNTAVTRNKFLSQVNPYLNYVQQRQGLYAFRVVMDETNNTPDVIDRNLLVGAIYLQPTRTAEFIQLTFNVLPTGVSFG